MAKPGALRRLLRMPFSVHNKHNNPNDDGVSVSLPEDNHNNNNNKTEGDDVLISLPEDIIFDVLARLPAKTLCKLRCVSKTWRALISDPAFKRFRAAAAPLVMGVFGEPCPVVVRFHALQPPLFHEQWFELRVIDSFDGSVLRVVKDFTSTRLMRSNLDLVLIDQEEQGASVIDPLSGQVANICGVYKKYPMTDHSGIRKIVRYTHYCTSALGRASPSGAYKIVRLHDARMGNGSLIQICQIATLGLQGKKKKKNGDIVMKTTWRQRPEPRILTRNFSVDSAMATVAGVLYLLDIGAPAYGNSLTPGVWNRIASFDLESEDWKATLDGPSSIGHPNEDESWDVTLAVLRGSLCLVQVVEGPGSR